MVLLNQWGRVAETTGSCLLVVRDGTISTPPPTEGALESITIDLAEEISRSLGIPFLRRPIDRTELCVADEISIAGTLSELAKVTHFDGHDLPDKTPFLDAVSECFWSAATG